MADRFDKFTERARKVLTFAQEEAQRFHHNDIGTEHLLLGLTRESDSVAAKVLVSMGVDLDQARSRVDAIIGPGDRLVMGEIGLTPRAKKVIELAVDEARRLNHHYIGTEHLLLGLVREGEGIGAGVLMSLGADLNRVRQEVLAVLAGEPGTAEPRQWVGRRVSVWPAGVRKGTPLVVLRHLVRVVPIAQSRQIGDLELTLLSLELYAEGFLLNGRLDHEDEAEARWPEAVLVSIDEAGREYPASPVGGTAIGTHWRFSHSFVPALPDSSPELLVRVDEIHWRRSDPATSQLVVEQTETGPWTFTIPLQGT